MSPSSPPPRSIAAATPRPPARQVLPSAEQGLAKERGGATTRKGLSLEDDDEYEIRVEAYDPAVLKHHVLNIDEDDIRRCFSSHPQLYTLG